MNERPESRRPLSAHLGIYRWHAPMLASIAHRMSGMVLILFVPLYLWLLRGMTGSEDNFAAVNAGLHSPLGKISLWIAGLALIYHFFNGMRFLLLDAGVGESRQMMRQSAKIVLTIATFAALLLAVLL